ncbi:class I SAM-dependent methyltransferase [Ferrovibrio sp.]|uniref:class I SAM-dependent methyltransferase n=1 Tax=Ferrovibrio sp. TaxID=1917215 RepID=UPI00263276F4|nr:class I SAM-dependent methyltransferase [Ferrovibrio sp.]
MSLPSTDEIAAKAHLLPMLRAAIRSIETENLDHAETFLDSILKQEPGFADALHLKGYIAFQRGTLDMARKLVEQAIAVDFHYENYHVTLGHILLAAGDRDAAKKSFGAAIALNPKYCEAYIGLAHIFIAEDALDAAIGALFTAQNASPKHAETNYMLGYAMMTKGDAKQAIRFFGIAHRLAPGNIRYKAGLARSLRDVRMKRPNPELVTSVLPLLGTPGVEPRDLAPVIESAICMDPLFIALNPIDDLPEKQASAVLADPACPDLMQIAALPVWLKHGLVSHPALERRLTALRRGFLSLALRNRAALQRYEPLLCLLAIRAFQAEYIDRVTTSETAQIESLATALDTLAPTEHAPLFAVYACYRPLYRRHDAASLAAAAWPAAYADLKRSQLDEPLGEFRIAGGIPALTPIEDQTSQTVQEMYEESPFPRWHQPILGTPQTVSGRLRTALPLQQIPVEERLNPDILVAGCGTGLHAILAATSYAFSKVLAIDLSRTSLAYAKRKATEIGIGNVDFAQADILKIGGIPQRFDVIESFGVLHHLRDPAAGLAQLVGLLKPGGYMMLGLYSELGRRDVVKARDLITQLGLGDSPEDVREFRRILPKRDPQLAVNLAKSSAYYALSDLRDLVFHRQEHRYTPQQLRRLIDNAGLDFLGFEFSSPKPLGGYRARFPDDVTATNLDHWAEMEIANPDLFANCYRFWVRRKG